MQKATLKMIKTRAGPSADGAAGEAVHPSGGRHPDPDCLPTVTKISAARPCFVSAAPIVSCRKAITFGPVRPGDTAARAQPRAPPAGARDLLIQPVHCRPGHLHRQDRTGPGHRRLGRCVRPVHGARAGRRRCARDSIGWRGTFYVNRLDPGREPGWPAAPVRVRRGQPRRLAAAGRDGRGGLRARPGHDQPVGAGHGGPHRRRVRPRRSRHGRAASLRAARVAARRSSAGPLGR
jgi:hypothetical protein